LCCSWQVAAEPSLTGQTGLINMPDARVGPDGSLRFGTSSSDPYFNVWGSVTFFPRLEVSGRYITIDGVPGFSDSSLGDYRDKVFDAKLVLLEESDWRPALAIGVQDYVGTRLFPSHYAVLSKQLGPFDVSAGVGRERIDGGFGGVRYTPTPEAGWSVAVEYDANDYSADFRADVSGAARREAGLAYAVEYRYGWLAAQLSRQHDAWAANAYVTIPLAQPEFIPKLHEPPPYDVDGERAGSAEWRANAAYAGRLMAALEQQGYHDVRLRLHGDTLVIALTHNRISRVGRAVGRAARTALKLGPDDIVSLHVVYLLNEQPLVAYRFGDLATLDRYFAGRVEREALDASVVVGYASMEDMMALHGEAELQFDVDAWDGIAMPANDRFLSPFRDDPILAGFDLLPFNLRIFFNDPGEPVRYDAFATVTYDRRLDRGLTLNGAARFTLAENVSDIRQSSNSVLPHVRSDIGEYRREGDDLRLDTLLLNKYQLWRERLYGRLSLGYYEEMYAGTGMQALYLPRHGPWAVDIALDWLRQREPGDDFGFRDYRVLTALTSLHYRVPAYGVTASARVGQFLAKDRGLRLELKRRFRSGVEFGLWYSWTDSEDITGPGSPDDPYRDKGIFASIPLSSMLTSDTRERAEMVLANYTRDVGQMVRSPRDLYREVERSLMLNSADADPLGYLTQ
jgi:hypothetical protein